MGRKRRERRDSPDEAVTPPKVERKEVRTSSRVSITEAKAELQKAKASKWKWLAILIGLVMAAYGVFKSKLIGG